jgi:hypothetical protein
MNENLAVFKLSLNPENACVLWDNRLSYSLKKTG